MEITCKEHDPTELKQTIKTFLSECKSSCDLDEIIISNFYNLSNNSYSISSDNIEDTHIINYVVPVIKPFFQDETVQDNFEEESSQLEHLIDKLPFDDPIMAIDYIMIDNEVVEEETVMEDEEIIATVTLTSNNGNQEEEIETPVVTLTEALRGAEALLNFVTYPPEKFEISTKQISSIRSVRSSILLYKSSLVHQRSIDEYVNFDV
ncbi:4558_t:CDS:2 [Entrophospora sp. SA101]|nr:4558_t:CDS:2 [Entrophospora sp. SA101]